MRLGCCHYVCWYQYSVSWQCQLSSAKGILPVKDCCKALTTVKHPTHLNLETIHSAYISSRATSPQEPQWSVALSDDVMAWGWTCILQRSWFLCFTIGTAFLCGLLHQEMPYGNELHVLVRLLALESWHKGTVPHSSRVCPWLKKEWDQWVIFPGWGQCLEFCSVLLHCWFGDRNGISLTQVLMENSC